MIIQPYQSMFLKNKNNNNKKKLQSTPTKEFYTFTQKKNNFPFYQIGSKIQKSRDLVMLFIDLIERLYAEGQTRCFTIICFPASALMSL